MVVGGVKGVAVAGVVQAGHAANMAVPVLPMAAPVWRGCALSLMIADWCLVDKMEVSLRMIVVQRLAFAMIGKLVATDEQPRNSAISSAAILLLWSVLLRILHSNVG